MRSADQIIVLEEGAIAERGTHDSLLAMNGHYADLYRKQQLDEVAERFPGEADGYEVQTTDNGASGGGVAR
ncbi:putative multidrug resistance ABC transporter ATP-binding/permease protein YheH [compost metagenome]